LGPRINVFVIVNTVYRAGVVKSRMAWFSASFRSALNKSVLSFQGTGYWVRGTAGNEVGSQFASCQL
jgi:hypothetical protein